jgi:hypothetical protein
MGCLSGNDKLLMYNKTSNPLFGAVRKVAGH